MAAERTGLVEILAPGLLTRLMAGELGEVEYENFNAASAVVTIHGCNMHAPETRNGVW